LNVKNTSNFVLSKSSLFFFGFPPFFGGLPLPLEGIPNSGCFVL